jgi:hypothetical protein
MIVYRGFISARMTAVADFPHYPRLFPVLVAAAVEGVP